MEVIIRRVPVYASGLGNPGPWMTELWANGTKVMVGWRSAPCHTGEVFRLDIIVAHGMTAGHNSPVGTMALIPQVVDAVGDTPVLGAGGISDGRGVRSANVSAEGVWVGSASWHRKRPISLTFKSRPLSMRRKKALVSRTVTGKPARIIRLEVDRLLGT